MRGGFRGEWWTYSSVPVKPIAAVIGAVVVVAWIAAHLLLIGIVLGLLVIALTGAVLCLRRTSDRDAEALARRSAALRAEAEEGRQLAAPKSLTVINVAPGAHLHLEAGTSAAAIVRQAPVQGAVIRKE